MTRRKNGQYLRSFFWKYAGYGKLSDDFSNVVVDGWSPNNLKRIVVGVDGMLFQWHTTGGGAKVPRLAEYHSYKDLEALEDAFSKKGNPLRLLLAGKRVFSNVEEVIIVRGVF